MAASDILWLRGWQRRPHNEGRDLSVECEMLLRESSIGADGYRLASSVKAVVIC